MQKKILLVGGTGLIGNKIQNIFKEKETDIQIRISSRRKETDNYIYVDIDRPDTFSNILRHNILLIVLCTTDPNDNMLTFCIKHSIDYLDITKPTNLLTNTIKRVENIQVNNKIVFASGWMGGLIPSLILDNTHFKDIEAIRINIFYSLKDSAGKSSADFMAENISKPYFIFQNNKPIRVMQFTERETYQFSFDEKKYNIYNFDIPDLHILYEIEKVPTISAKITYSSSLITNTLAILQQMKVFNFLSLDTKKKIFYSNGGGDRTGFELIIKKKNKGKQRISLTHSEGQIALTAYCTALHIEELLDNKNLENKIYFAHQLYDKGILTDKLKNNQQIKLNNEKDTCNRRSSR